MTVFVSNWMTTQLLTASPETTLREAVDLMRSAGLRRLPIVRGGELLGLLTESDILQARPASSGHFVDWEVEEEKRDIPVSKVMSADPVRGRPDMLLDEAAELMIDHKISSLPIVENDRLVGIITLADIFRAFKTLFEGGERKWVGAIIETQDAADFDELHKILVSHEARLVALLAERRTRKGQKRLVRFVLTGDDAEATLEAVLGAGYRLVRRLDR